MDEPAENEKPQTPKSNAGIFLLIMLTAFIVMAVIVRFNEPSLSADAVPASRSGDTVNPHEVVPAPPPPITISASDLWRSYDKNEVAADQSYKGRDLIVSGVIDSIAQDAFDHPFVTLNTGDYLTVVKCSFSDEDKAQLAGLAKGQYVTIDGTCTGKLLSIGLSSCSLK